MRDAWLAQAKAAGTDGARSYASYMAEASVRVFERHCTDDAWSDKAIACAHQSAKTCDGLLTKDQLDRLQNDKRLNL
jgi:hypothetical protein